MPRLAPAFGERLPFPFPHCGVGKNMIDPSLSRADVEQAVRDAFAGGLAPAPQEG